MRRRNDTQGASGQRPAPAGTLFRSLGHLHALDEAPRLNRQDFAKIVDYHEYITGYDMGCLKLPLAC